MGSNRRSLFVKAACMPIVVLALSSTMLHAHDGAKFEPPDGKILHGAGQDIDSIGFNNYANALALAAGSDAIHPMVNKAYFPLWDRNAGFWFDQTITFQQWKAMVIDPLEDWLMLQKANGIMPEISISFGVDHQVFGDLIIPSGALDPLIIELARLVREHGDPCFVRPGFEPNEIRYTIGGPYIESYRHIVDIFRAEGVDNAAYIWCAGPVGGLLMAQSGNWFPGDEYVDRLGVDVFTPDNFTSNPTYSWYAFVFNLSLSSLSQTWHKPIYLSETSAVFPGGIALSDSTSADTYWATWFGPFYEAITSHPRVKGFNYINWDWPPHGFPWVDSRIENNPFLVDMIKDELLSNDYVHRDTPNKFQHPYLRHLGRKVPLGGSDSIVVDNVDPFATGQNPGLILFIWGLERITVPPIDSGYLNYTLGSPLYTQYLHINLPPGASFLVPTKQPDGSYQLDLTLPAGLVPIGTILYFQAYVEEPVTGLERLTQAYRIEVVP